MPNGAWDRKGVKRMEPDSSQWCPATGLEVKGTDWNT